jgi:hypothetical protein
MCCTVATHAQITFVLSNLMLTGLATPFLHNGIITAEAPEEGSEDFQVNSESFHSQWKYCITAEAPEEGSHDCQVISNSLSFTWGKSHN